MANAKRFSYSLLFSSLVFAVFTVIAFSGLFPWVEAQFYSPRVTSDLQSRLIQTSADYERWKLASLSQLDKLVGDPAFAGVFSPSSSRESIQRRFQITKLFLLGVKGGGAIRFLSSDRSQIHFSSEDADVKARKDYSLTYRPAVEVPGLPDLRGGGVGESKVQVIDDPSRQSLVLLKPWKDPQSSAAGYVLASFSLEDWKLSLSHLGLASAEPSIVSLGHEEFLLSLLGRTPDSALLARVKELRGQGILPPLQKLAQSEGGPLVALVHHGAFNILVPASMLELDSLLKALILLSIYTVLFLVTFLFANLRGEPLSSVTRKVKQFQLQVVKQYFDLKEPEKIQSLRDELARHSTEIQADVRRSLGKVRRQDREFVDRYIDTSWQEVLDLFRGPAPPAESSSNADWKRLETLLQQALTQGRFVVSGPPSAAGGPAAGSPLRPASARSPVPVVDLEEDLEELDDVEMLEDADAADELEEVEELTEAEEPEELAEVEDAEEIEEVEDLEDLEDVEELDEVAGENVQTSPPLAAPIEDEEELLEELEEVEAEAEDERDLEPVEELEPLEDRSPVFHARQRPADEGPLTVLPFSPEGDTLDPSEQLDELEEVDESEGEAVPQGADFSFSLERLDQAWAAAESGVFQEQDDVVTLSEDVFSQRSGADDAFGQLVDEVLQGPDSEGFLPLEKEDLLPEHHSREWRWTSAGFDWDRFALGGDEVNLFRALSDIVTELDAFTAAILVNTDGRWQAQSSVGFSDAGKAHLDFSSDSALSVSFLNIRALHVLHGGGAHPVLRDSFHVKDMKFLKSILCVPLLYRRAPAWLLLGLRRDPDDLLHLLAPRRIG